MRATRITIFAALFLTIYFASAQSAAASDSWLQLKSKNFTLIGDVSEKDIRRVATRLEQFREAFRRVFNQAELNSSIPTTVVVFKSDSAYRQFKPLRDGKIDEKIAGYFVAGDDVNYIALADGRDEGDTFGTIFHEFVHFIVDTNYGRTGVPAWLNEGLAEYFETFAIDGDQKVKLGLVQDRHLQTLKQYRSLPLKTLFETTNYALSEMDDHTRSIFYAQSWAIVHYLVQAGKIDRLNNFLELLSKNTPPERAFQQSFRISYADLESELQAYLIRRTYNYRLITFPAKLTYDAGVKVLPVDEADADATLGDLLFHAHREDDAVPYLLAALKLQPEQRMANETLAMLKINQRKYDEAKPYLETVVRRPNADKIALYRYAYLLSREGRDEFGYVDSYAPETTAKMRDLLKRAIAADPSFSESYYLLAYISLVNNDGLDDAARYLNEALKYRPGNERYMVRLAEIYTRQGRLEEAEALAKLTSAGTSDASLQALATTILEEIKGRRETKRRADAEKLAYESTPERKRPPGLLRKVETDKAPTPEQVAKMQEDAFMRALNLEITGPAAGETQILGSIERIDCNGIIAFSVVAGTERFMLTSKDFQALKLNTFIPEDKGLRLGCGTDIAGSVAVLTYKKSADQEASNRGELTAIDFVPKNFRFVDLTAEAPPTIIFPQGPAPSSAETESARRTAMLANIRTSLRTAGDGEIRDIGVVGESKCGAKGAVFTLITATRTLRLTVTSPESLRVRGYTPDIVGLQIKCGVSVTDIPAVFIYRDKPDTKNKTAGELLSLEFVPRSFVLN